MAENTKPSAELEALLAEKEQLLAEREQLLAAQAARLQELESQNAKANLLVEGIFKLEGEDPRDPKKKSVTEYQFTPGAIRTRLKNGEEVSSAALLKLANGGTLEPEESHPALVALGTEGAKGWLTHLITAKQATFLKVVVAVLILLMALPFAASAQVKSGFVQNFYKDTLTNADTVYWTVAKQITDLEPIEGIWQVSYAGISGTPSVIIQIQERSIQTDNAWEIVVTDTVNASDKAIFYTQTVRGVDQRVFVRSTGTQVTRPLAQVRYRRKYQYP